MPGRGGAQACGSAGVFEDRESRRTETREEGVSVDPGHVRHETECPPSGFPLFPEAAGADGWGKASQADPGVTHGSRIQACRGPRPGAARQLLHL